MADEFTWAPIRGVPMEAVMLSLRGTALRVLLVLLKFANKSMRCWPGREAILRYLPPDHDVRNLRRAMRELVARGVVTIETTRQKMHDGREGGQGRNIYTIHIPSLKKIRASYELEKSAGRGVKNGRAGCQKRSSASAPYREVLQLEPRELKDRRSPVKSGGAKGKTKKLSHPEEAKALVSHFATLYQKKTGEPMALFPKHLWIMNDLVASIGDPAARAAVETWFDRGPWSRWSEDPEIRYRMHGGFERCIESIQYSEKYTDRKNRYGAGH